MRGLVLGLAVVALAGCAAPFGLGEPSRAALERGVEDSLNSGSFEMTGTYTESTNQWSIDLQIAHPAAEHILLDGPQNLEVIVVGGQAYFRGQRFLAGHLGSDPVSQNLVKAAGNAWWKGTSVAPPQLPDLTKGVPFRTFFLGAAVDRRTDHVSVDGVDTAELSGLRGDVYVAEAAPNQLVRLHTNKGVAVDGVSDGDFRFGNYNRNFRITAPNDVIDFTNLSTLPPLYTVVSVDTSGCASPCVVSAQLKNLGGLTGAKAPSTVAFTMKDAASNQILGSCQATVAPDVGYNGNTTVTCTISNISGQPNAAVVTATVDNPGHA